MDARVWTDAQAGCLDSRDLLIQQFTPLVGYVVGRIRGSIPAWVDADDLISYGHLGLMDAIQRFNPHRGVRFTNYASRRIRGHILDELRKTDWAPRRLRPNARAVAQAHERLTAVLAHPPTDEEIAEELGWEVSKVTQVTADASQALLESLEGLEDRTPRSLAGTSEENSAANFTSPHASVDSEGEERMLEIESIQRLSQGFGLLSADERTLLALYYFEQMSFKKIAQTMGVNESWVCLIHRRAMSNLRSLTTI